MTNEEKFYKFLKKCTWYYEEISETLYQLRDEIINLRLFFKEMFKVNLYDHEIADFIEFFADQFDLKTDKAIDSIKKLKKDNMALYMDKWIEKKKREIDDNRIKAPRDIF